MTTVRRPFDAFFRSEAAGGVLLLVAALVALAWANSPFAAGYFALWDATFTVGGGPLVIAKPLSLWVNDGLMAVFFFLVGLEIKREVVAGELAQPRQAALAVAAALGGMVAPALLYAAVTAGTDRLGGWGVPMATDIAFAIGVLAIVGSRAPLALKVFLTALAIVDDLAAVVVIALFYTASIKTVPLAVAGAAFVVLVGINRAGVFRPTLYVLVGVVMWVAMLKSGVHATIAGVLTALTIPAVRRADPAAFAARARGILDEFAARVAPGQTEPDAEQAYALTRLEEATEDAESPLARLEHALHRPVALLVMPVFALANAGVAFRSNPVAMLADPAALGILAGLVVGKPVGVMAMAFLAVRTGLAAKPPGRHVGPHLRRRPADRHRLHDVDLYRHARLCRPRRAEPRQGRHLSRLVRRRHARRARGRADDAGVTRASARPPGWHKRPPGRAGACRGRTRRRRGPRSLSPWKRGQL